MVDFRRPGHIHLYLSPPYSAFFAILFGIMSVSEGNAFAPSYAKARLSAKRIFALVDLVPSIDSFSVEGDKLVHDHVIHYSPRVQWSLYRLKLMDKCHWRKWSLSILLDPMYLCCKGWVCRWSLVKRWLLWVRVAAERALLCHWWNVSMILSKELL